jgi:hypothetical protein
VTLFHHFIANKIMATKVAINGFGRIVAMAAQLPHRRQPEV